MHRPTLSRRHVLGWLCSGLLPAAAGAAGDTGAPLVFGLITPREPERIVAAWQPFLDRIAQRIGQPISAWPAPTPSALVQAFAQERVHLGWIGNAPALELVAQGVGEVFAQMVTAGGQTGYRSILVTHRNSGLRDLQGVLQAQRQRVFGDGEPKSTSGHLVPLYYAFVRRGINDPRALFAEVRVGNHRQNLLRAAEREVDVATANDVELELFAREQPALAETLRVIWRSPTIPQSPLVWHTRLPLPTRRRLLQAVVSFGQDAAERQILQRLNDLSGFRRSRNLQLVPVADIEMFAAWQQVNNDPALSPAEKNARVAAISERASRLELRLKMPPSVP